MSNTTDPYDIPTKTDYFKPENGESVIRLLAEFPLRGEEGWVKKDVKARPVRIRVGENFPEPVEDAKHFWAFPIWNYALRRVQVYQMTQISVMKPIKEAAKNPRWGSPTGYDLAITKGGSGFDTEYAVMPLPKEPLNEVAEREWLMIQSSNFDLSRLYDNGDPFGRDANPDNDITF